MPYRQKVSNNILTLTEHSHSRTLIGIALIAMAPVLLFAGSLYSTYAVFATIPIALFLLVGGTTIAGGRETVMVDREKKLTSTQSRLFMLRGERRERKWSAGREIVISDQTLPGGRGRFRLSYLIQIGGDTLYETHSEEDVRLIAFYLSDFLELPIASRAGGAD